MTKTTLLYSALLTLLILGVWFRTEASPILILNMDNVEELPRNFRFANGDFCQEGGFPSRDGLDELQASGSAQFSVKGLEAMLEAIPNRNIYIIDLRQESHGFINGMGVSWYGERDWMNVGRTCDEIECDERTRLMAIKNDGWVMLYVNKIIPVPVFVDETCNERAVMRDMSLRYKRFYITDHVKPCDQDVDAFINFAKTLKKQDWLHFHCAAGKGRTTTFMVMYDMIRNAKKVPIEDILARQLLVGGIDLSVAPTYHDAKEWKQEYIAERVEFLKHFYRYCVQNENFEVSWTDWSAEHLAHQNLN